MRQPEIRSALPWHFLDLAVSLRLFLEAQDAMIKPRTDVPPRPLSGKCSQIHVRGPDELPGWRAHSVPQTSITERAAHAGTWDRTQPGLFIWIMSHSSSHRQTPFYPGRMVFFSVLLFNILGTESLM